ncbi:MAG: agmatinase [Omnitrophica bacterium RBG_13_46_9]|nr:MAG: agmatinase [Omnitrophica bacterium RBG_13_46_9]
MEELILEKRFGNIEENWSGFKGSSVCIIQAPYEGTVTYVKGAANGPEAIIEASLNMELFDEELQLETYKIGICTNLPLGTGSAMPPEEVINKVNSSVTDVLKADKFPVVLGGEHSVSIGAVRAAKKFFKKLSVLFLDAHYDLRDEYMDSKYNHSCVARRIQEICPIAEVGVRSLCRETKDFLNQDPPNIKVFSVYDILKNPDWKQAVSKSLTDAVYITIDLDVLDPSIMPSVGTPEPGGLGWYELLSFLKTITSDRKIVGFDIVELSPKEGFVAPDFLAAKLIYRLLGYIFVNRK